MKILDSISSPFQSPNNKLNSSNTDENMKYKLTNKSITLENGIKLYQIRALKDFSNVKVGDLGGFVESEDNLSHNGNCWIYNSAKVYDNARVYGKAEIYGNARVYENACIYGNAQIFENSKIFGKASIYDNAKVYGDVEIFGKAKVYNNACVSDDVQIYGNTCIFEYAKVFGKARIYGKAYVHGESQIYEHAQICDDAQVYGKAEVFGRAKIYGDAWPVTPFYFCLSKHQISSCSYIHIRIGCQVYAIDEWKERGEELGKENGYSYDEIELYREAIRLAEKYIELVKKEANK